MKNKYFISLAAIIFIAGASIIGSVALIFNILPQTFADSSLPHCANIKKYARWTDNYSMISSPINITADEIASYEVPDQSTRCQVVINLNGYTTTEAYVSASSFRSNLIVGNNAVVTVNGGGGTITLGSPEDEPNTPAVHVIPRRTDGIVVASGGELYLNNVTVNSHGEILYNSGTAVLTNVATTEKDDIWNDGGNLTIESGTYDKVSTANGGTTTINGGTFSNIESDSDSDVIINGGSVSGGTVVSRLGLELASSSMTPTIVQQPSEAQSFTINGGDFSGIVFESPVIVNGGTFDNIITGADITINNGTFTNSEFIGGTTFMTGSPIEISINDGTFTSSTFDEGTTVNNGTFISATFDENTTINDGNFTSSTFSDDTTINGGTYDELPENYTVPEDKTIVSNEDGTQTIYDTAEVIAPSSDPSNPTPDPGDDEAAVCSNIRIYTSKDNYFTVSSILSLSADVKVSIVIPDQNEPCKFVINLNGHTLTSADESLEAIKIGSNVEAEIDGGFSENTGAGSGTGNEDITGTIVAATSGGVAISNSGTTTISNVDTGDATVENDGGDLTIESGTYGAVESGDNAGSVTVNGGSFTTPPSVEDIPDNKQLVENGDGTYSIIDTTPTDPTNPTDPAGDEVATCSEVRVYTSPTDYYTVSDVLSLTDDMNASIVIQDQSEPCKFTINLNGHTLTGVEEMDTISVGANVEATIENGTIETPSSENAGVSNSGTTTLENVTSTEAPIENNAGGELIIESGSYGTINSSTEGSVTINENNTTYDEESSNIPTADPTSPTNPTADPETPSESEQSTKEPADESAGLGRASIKIPNTGVVTEESSFGQPLAIGTVITIEASILAACGYTFRRINKSRKIRF